jgi:hypothetical protein
VNRGYAIGLLALTCCSTRVCADETASAPEAASAPAPIPSLRYSIGGEARERFEWIRHSSWGAGVQDDNGYLLQRYMLQVAADTDSFRLFVQLASSLESGRAGGPRSTDEDRADLHQAYVDLRLRNSRDAELVVRVGRQELEYGSARLVSVREGPNVRLAFDGLKTIIKAGRWQTDLFAARPVLTNPATWDDNGDRHRALWGLYATGPAGRLPGAHLDLYYLGLNRDKATFKQGAAREERHSFGGRLWGRQAGWDYNLELIYQLGSFGPGEIRAWTAASDLGFTVAQNGWKPRLGVKMDITSGDRDPASPSLQAFNPLFPRGSYFGEPALIGPANHVDIHPSLSVTPSIGVTLRLDWIGFWRQRRGDGLYGPAGNLLVAGAAGQSKHVGNQVEAKLEWSLTRHLTLVADAARFITSGFLKESTPGRDVSYVSTWITFRF